MDKNSLFHTAYGLQLNDFPKNKQAASSTKEKAALRYYREMMGKTA